MATVKQGHEIPTIDVALVTIQPHGSDTELGLKTASQVQVNPQTETVDAVKLVVKGALIAQKGAETTITGNTIILTDNVFNAELVKILQGGTIKYWADATRTTTSTTDAGYGIASYAPPKAGSSEKGVMSTVRMYSAVYDTSGELVEYERITYPNCQGVPVAFGAQDGTFRAPEYTINSAPKKNEEPYVIDYIEPDDLPEVNLGTTPTTPAG